MASAKVTGASGASSDRVNVSSVTRTGAGVYAVLLTSGLVVTERHISLTLRDTSAGMIAVVANGTTTFTVNTFDDAGAAADRDFEFAVLQTTSA